MKEPQSLLEAKIVIMSLPYYPHCIIQYTYFNFKSAGCLLVTRLTTKDYYRQQSFFLQSSPAIEQPPNNCSGFSKSRLKTYLVSNSQTSCFSKVKAPIWWVYNNRTLSYTWMLGCWSQYLDMVTMKWQDTLCHKVPSGLLSAPPS